MEHISILYVLTGYAYNILFFLNLCILEKDTVKEGKLLPSLFIRHMELMSL